jgi:hypothetical protein
MYTYQSQSGRFEVAAYTSTRCWLLRMAAVNAPSFNTRAEAEAWRVATEVRIRAEQSGAAA